jgi:hypothetical protein
VRRIATLLAALALVGSTASATRAADLPRLADRVVLVLDHGRAVPHVDRFDPPSVAPEPAMGSTPAAGPRARAARAKLTFAAGLDRLLAAGQIDQATRDADRAALLAARRSLGRITGTRHVELGAVLAILDEVAAAGGLTPSRLPELVLTLTRNRTWWTTGPLLSAGRRVGFAGSELVWQYYPGQGLQIQWLGTFGKANGYFLGGTTHNTQLAALLDEAIALAAQRAGGIAWEYDFHFDGGSPPWVSGLAEGTAVQALGRAAVRFGRPDYFTAASSGLGIFSAPPPAGVRVGTPVGARYLIYSFAPHELVINAFVQALVGLYDYAGLSNSDAVRALFTAGEAQARIDVPHYDTGAWSLYDQSTESDLSYHVLLRDFLSHLCERLRAPATVAQTVVTPPPPAATTVGPSGGTPAGTPTTPTPTPAPSPGPAPASTPSADVYCTAADHFTAYMHQPPVLAITPVGRARAGRAGDVRLLLSKISTVTLVASRAGRTVYRMREQLGHGTRMLAWRPPAPGRYRLTADATDLAGNSAQAAAVTVTAAARSR